MSKVLTDSLLNPELPTASPKNARQLRDSPIGRWVNSAGIFLPVAALIVLGRVLSPAFLTSDNLLNMLQTVALLGIVAVGVTFITYSGHYVDLSIPAMMALSGITVIATLPLGFAPALICGLLAAAAVGAINGFAVGYLRLNPIIWTLAVLSIVDGLIRWAFGGNQIYPSGATSAGRLMLALYDTRFVGIPITVVILAILTAAGWFLMKHTVYGTRLKIVGSSYEAARMTGIDARAQVALAFVLSALATAVAGILLTSLNKVGAAYIGAGYDFSSITAVVIGGVTLNGGRGSVLGVLGGVLVIGLLRNIMTLMGLGAFSQIIVQGCVFIAAVGLSSYALRRAGRDDS